MVCQRGILILGIHYRITVLRLQEGFHNEREGRAGACSPVDIHAGDH